MSSRTTLKETKRMMREKIEKNQRCWVYGEGTMRQEMSGGGVCIEEGQGSVFITEC